MARLVSKQKGKPLEHGRDLLPYEVDEMVKSQLNTGSFEVPGTSKAKPPENPGAPLVPGAATQTNYTEEQLTKMSKEELEASAATLGIDPNSIIPAKGKSVTKDDLIDAILEAQGEGPI